MIYNNTVSDIESSVLEPWRMCGSRQYFRSPSGVRVNTVEAKTIPRKTNSAKPAAAWNQKIFLRRKRTSAKRAAAARSAAKQAISRTVQGRLWIVRI